MINHKATREGDEFACPCGLRWAVGEKDPHTTCYQCERTTDYLYYDSRCLDCTRVTPEEMRGESSEEDTPDGEDSPDAKPTVTAEEASLAALESIQESLK